MNSSNAPFNESATFADYGEMQTRIETRLTALRREKNQTLESVAAAQIRLAEIELTENKLQSVFDSLGELLLLNGIENPVSEPSHSSEVFPPDTAHESTESAASTLNEATETTASVEMARVEVPPAAALLPTADAPLNETVVASETADAANENQTKPETENTIADFSVPDAPLAAAPVAGVAGAETDEIIADFNPRRFYRQFPHLKKTHPVHMLARGVLEYVGRGLKISDVARLVERLGYSHQSKNFTDTVHSSLKNRRASHKDFVYNKDLRVWELSVWSALDENKTAADAAVNNIEAVVEENKNTSGSTASLTQQVEEAIGRELLKVAKKGAAATATITNDDIEQAQKSSPPEDTARNLMRVRRAAVVNGIAVYKKKN